MTFSVIVPIYKVEKYLIKCIDSIINQTCADFELLLVDDGSPDNCPQICDDYAFKDSRIRVIHKPNGGLVNARNTGIQAAKGDYICYVDGDDWIELNLLETVYSKAISKSAPDMVVFGAKRCFNDHEVAIPSGLKEGLYTHSDLEDVMLPYMIYDNRKPFCTGLIFPVAWNKIYKREFLLEHYCREERIKMGEDNAFVFECLFYANEVFFCDDILYDYNQLNSGSMVHSYDSNRFQNNRLLTDYIENRLGEVNEMLDYQINAFKAYWLIMAIFHEVKSGIRFHDAVNHIRSGIEDTECVDGIKLNQLPMTARALLLLVKMKLYSLVIIGAKIVNSGRENR